MTNDEIIEIFQNNIKWAQLNRYPYISEREVEAYRIVIELLKERKLERESCEDCISREWLLKQPLDVANYPSNYVKIAPSVKPKSETNVLDKIRTEINKLSPMPTAEDVIDGNEVKDAIWEILIEVDKIIDKYRQEGI